MSIVVAIIAFSFLIFIHELGHFIVAKTCGIKVNEFSMFMGPKLVSWGKGETKYSIRAIPIGGYVKMEGEEESSDDERAYNKQPVWKRFCVIAAGPLMNILVAVLLVFIVFINGGYPTNTVGAVTEGSSAYMQNIRAGDRITKLNGSTVRNQLDFQLLSYGRTGSSDKLEVQKPDGSRSTVDVARRYMIGIVGDQSATTGPDSLKISDVSKGYPAEAAGIAPGDILYSMTTADGTAILKDFSDVSAIITKSAGNPMTVTVMRNGEMLDFSLTPVADTSGGIDSLSIAFGSSPYAPWMVSRMNAYISAAGGDATVSSEGWNPAVILKDSAIYSFSIAKSVFYSIKWLVTGTVSTKELSGPVGIVSIIGNVVQQVSVPWMLRFFDLLQTVAFISINVGLFNLIPFPALDGSKLILLVVEKIRRKPIPAEKEAMISFIGLALLIMLMLYATFNDVIRIGLFK